MSRQNRPQIDGGIYHVMNRGNRKQRIFEDDRDRRRFNRLLIEEKERHGVDILAGCQMGNHFHVIVGTPRGNLSQFMERFEGRFASYSNWRHRNVGHVFQGRFRGIVIENDLQLLTALCYVFYNPIRARLVTRLDDYKWSTYAATVGLEPRPGYLSLDWLMSLFPGASIDESQQRFRRLISQADPVAAYLGPEGDEVDCEAVRQIVRSHVGDQLRLAGLPRLYRSLLRQKLSELIVPGLTATQRANAIHEAHVVHGYTLAEIAREMRLHPSTTSKIFRSLSMTRRSSERDSRMEARFESSRKKMA